MLLGYNANVIQREIVNESQPINQSNQYIIDIICSVDQQTMTVYACT